MMIEFDTKNDRTPLNFGKITLMWRKERRKEIKDHYSLIVAYSSTHVVPPERTCHTTSIAIVDNV